MEVELVLFSVSSDEKPETPDARKELGAAFLELRRTFPLFSPSDAVVGDRGKRGEGEAIGVEDTPLQRSRTDCYLIRWF